MTHWVSSGQARPPFPHVKSSLASPPFFLTSDAFLPFLDSMFGSAPWASRTLAIWEEERGIRCVPWFRLRLPQRKCSDSW